MSSFAVNGKETLLGETGYHIIRATAATPILNTSYSLSSSFMGRGMTKDDGIAEILIYNTEVSSAAKNQIESYLAIKYGISLDQTTPRNYIDSSGAILWDAVVNSSYTNDVFGIGRDTKTTLDQRVSRNSDYQDVLFLSTNTDFASENMDAGRPQLTDKTFVLVGNNGGSSSMNQSFEGIANRRIARIWKVENTNVSSAVTFGITSGSIMPSPGTQMQLALAVSTDTTFTAADTIIPLVTGGAYQYATTTLPADAYVTFVTLHNGVLSIQAPIDATTGAITTQAVEQNITIDSSHFIVDDQQGAAA